MRGQFNQTADAKAEQKLVEWFILKFTFFEEELKEENKTELFPLFQGENYNEKREHYLELSDPDSENDDAAFIKARSIFLL